MLARQYARRSVAVIAFLASAAGARAQGLRPATVDPRDTIASFAVGGWGVRLADRDLTVSPGDDFVRYAVGQWLDANAREGLDRNNSYWRDLMRLPARRVVRMLQELGADRSLSPNTVEGKAAAFYRAFMDSAAIRRKGLTPLEPALAAIRGVRTHADLARVMGMEAGAWTPRPFSPTVQTFPLALFAVRIDQNPRSARR